jgi:hypothetical protein
MKPTTKKEYAFGSFDVTRVVATVELTKGGTVSAFEAALAAIGREGIEGTYTFPTNGDGTARVTVSFETEVN